MDQALPPSTTRLHPDPTAAREGYRPAAVPEEHLLPHFVRAEANLLRLPLFALGTKGLKTLDGIECTGRISREGQTHQFTFRATRNTATLYPGPLARSAHLAFLSLLTEQGLPLQNPLRWGWRDLCRRMRVVYGGQMVRHLKEAITATALLGIQSHYGLYSKADGALLHTHQDTLHLYDRVTFVGSPLPDGTVADSNYLWLSGWYLSNLNALYAAPLDYDLWRSLDERSPIASRLYEWLSINLYGVPVLRINYETLAQFLPVRPERYRSLAQRQLQPALTLLTDHAVLKAAAWTDSKDGLAQLQFARGDRLSAPAGRSSSPLPSTDMDETLHSTIEVKELRNLKPPEWGLVTEFYKLWAGQEHARPTPKELAQARELLQQHGPAKTKALIPLAVNELRQHWPEAKSFAAVEKYVPEAVAEYERQQRAAERRKEERLREQQEQDGRAEHARAQAALKALWDRLPEEGRAPIRDAILAKQPRVLLKHPALLERLCLEEFSRRQHSPSRDGDTAAEA